MQQRERHVLGLPEMDTQHEYLYNLFDKIQLNELVIDVEKMQKLLQEIENYILFHFSSEQHLMRIYKVPSYAVHQSDHEQFENAFAQFLDDFEGKTLNPKKLYYFLVEWLDQHSRISDSEYVKWIVSMRLMVE